MKFSLRTLLIWLAVLPPLLAAAVYAVNVLRFAAPHMVENWQFFLLLFLFFGIPFLLMIFQYLVQQIAQMHKNRSK